MKTVTIEPVDTGWVVTSTLGDNPMFFLSGRKAEDAGLRLARVFADAGQLTELKVKLRDGREVVRLIDAGARDVRVN